MVLYGINLFPLIEELRSEDPGLLIPLYADDKSFDGLAQRSAQLLKLLMDRKAEQGYLPKPAKSLFIADTPDQEEMAKRDFVVEAIELDSVGGSRYLGAYLFPQGDLKAGVKPQV